MVGTPCITLDTTSHKIHGISELFHSEIGSAYDATDLASEMKDLLQRVKVILKDGGSIGHKMKLLSQNYGKEFDKSISFVK